MLSRLHAEHYFYQAVQNHPDFKNFSIEKVLKAGPRRTTVAASLNGEKVVLKRYLTENARETVRKAKQELDFIARSLSDPHRVNECIAIYPGRGIIVLSFVPGVQLDAAISEANPEEREKLFKLSGNWLQAYVSLRNRKDIGFSPNWWIKKRTQQDVSHFTTEDQNLFAALLENLGQRAPHITGKDIMKAAVHGDYVGMNAHYHDGTIYGVDLQGEAWLPIVTDVARFLVWSQTKTPPTRKNAEDHLYGIAKSDLESFFSSGVVPTEEAHTLFPFFVGHQLLGRLNDFQKDADALTNLRLISRRFLSDTL